MDDIRELTRLVVIDIVDNSSDGMTSPCPAAASDNVRGCSYSSEFETMADRTDVLDPNRLCYGAHGLCILLVAEYVGSDGKLCTRRLLLDAGPNPSLFRRNARCLHVPLGTIDALVLSHYHWDHYGGLQVAVQGICTERKVMATLATPRPPLVVDLHPDVAWSRAAKSSRTGEICPRLPDFPALKELRNYGADVELNDAEHLLCDGCFYISGFIPRRTEYEKGLPNSYSKKNEGEWVQDTEIREERYVACRVRGLGLVVFSSCSHAGIVNVCNDITSKAKGVSLAGVVGGFHLGGTDVEDRIERTVEDLRGLRPSIILPGHCTGWKAHRRFAEAFGSTYQPLAVGATYTFE